MKRVATRLRKNHSQASRDRVSPSCFLASLHTRESRLEAASRRLRTASKRPRPCTSLELLSPVRNPSSSALSARLSDWHALSRLTDLRHPSSLDLLGLPFSSIALGNKRSRHTTRSEPDSYKISGPIVARPGALPNTFSWLPNGLFTWFYFLGIGGATASGLHGFLAFARPCFRPCFFFSTLQLCSGLCSWGPLSMRWRCRQTETPTPGIP